LQDLRGRAGSLEAEIKRPAGDPADAAGERLGELRRRLDAVECELAGPPK
jgi:hypothetical protein